MNYLREGDTLVISRLDRLARSVVHLSHLAKRFESEGIDLLVVDQNIDTSTSTGRLMFNMLASIAEFENDLRTERQSEGIAKAKENGVKFGRPPKVTEEKKQEIYSRRISGVTIGQLTKEFNLGEATIYRALSAVKPSETKIKTTKVILWLEIQNNSKFVRGKGKSKKHIEDYLLSEYHPKKLREGEYELTFEYSNEADLDQQIYDLSAEMASEAGLRDGFIECDFNEVGTDRSW